jgi:hypothetical protein
MSRLPNFLYIGTSKAGSTWLYNVLDNHPDIYMAPGKAIYFFCNHYERGLDWYSKHFEGATQEKVVGEVSHSYLYSPEACQRIANIDSDVRLMACLRDPVDRAFSDYLDGLKNGQFQGSFEEELERVPSLIDRGRYAKHLACYVEQFGLQRLHIGVFDELGASPDEFARKLFSFLNVEERELPKAQQKKIMPAGKPRSKLLAQMAKKASHAARSLGLRKLRGKVKTSRLARDILYRQYTPEEKPQMARETKLGLRQMFKDEIVKLDSLLNTDFQELWGYK